MYKSAASARLCYIEGAYANAADGMTRPLYVKPLFYLFKYLPFGWTENMVSRMMSWNSITWLFRKIQLDWQNEDQRFRAAGWGAIAKFIATDAGMKNSHLAVELMGQAGIRHDREAEKFLRDAKLLQVCEGTNQLNRVNAFEAFVGRHHPQMRVYEHE